MVSPPPLRSRRASEFTSAPGVGSSYGAIDLRGSRPPPLLLLLPPTSPLPLPDQPPPHFLKGFSPLDGTRPKAMPLKCVSNGHWTPRASRHTESAPRRCCRLLSFFLRDNKWRSTPSAHTGEEERRHILYKREFYSVARPQLFRIYWTGDFRTFEICERNFQSYISPHIHAYT
jgi:hypothetical protein